MLTGLDGLLALFEAFLCLQNLVQVRFETGALFLHASLLFLERFALLPEFDELFGFFLLEFFLVAREFFAAFGNLLPFKLFLFVLVLGVGLLGT